MPSETQFAFQTAFLQQIEIKNIHARHSRTGGNPEGSTNSTKPIHLVLQHLRESFSLS
ncbi:hypothetical protein [Neisseria meningitidis]|uniref:hypothetical protein n=1 Tax=Neisseria meningitidis TaxID=487 RepID=UPI0025788CDD|nr:hypothetical protein [Neisseria meningitidis]